MIKPFYQTVFISLLIFSNLSFADLFRQANAAYELKDYQNAFKLFKRAAKKGNPKAQYNLAYLYDRGVGTTKNLRQAIFWYKKAAAKKHINASYNLAYLYQHANPPIQNYKAALESYKVAAKLGSISALVNIGRLYFMGQGVKKNYSEAYSWFLLAIARGSRNGLNNRDIVSRKLSPFAIADGEKLYIKRRPIYIDPFLK